MVGAQTSFLLAVLIFSLGACRHSEAGSGTREDSGKEAAEIPAITPRKGVSYLGEPIDVVDLHMHPGRYEDLGPIGRDFLRKTLPDFLPVKLKDLSLTVAANFLLNPYGKFIGIKTEAEQAGINRVGLFAVYAPMTWGVTSNETVIKFLDDERNWDYQGKPYFFGLASVKMQDWESHEAEQLDALRKALDHSQMKGIKLAFIHNSIPLSDTRYDGVYDVALERGVPVYHHIGSSPLRKLSDFADRSEQENYIKSYDPAGLERAIAKYPNVPFIMGHLGYDFNHEGYSFSEKVFELASRYSNVYLEISAFGDSIHDPDGAEMRSMLEIIKARRLISRTIYGSDGPNVPGGTKKYLAGTIKAMEQIGYTHAEAEAVLAKTTRRLFKIYQ